MPRYIDADVLYEQTAEWEARALAVVEKLNSKPLGEMDADEIAEWRKWSCILNERSAFKHDVADAPTADVVEVVRCKDCKYSRKITDANVITLLSCNYQNAHGMLVENHGYCKWGKRKETEDA